MIVTSFKTIIVVAALAIAGCGGDSADEGAGAPDATAKRASTGPSAAERAYIAKADAICKEANEQETALGAVGVGFIHDKQFDDPKFLARFTPIGAAAARELKTLEAPAGDEKLAATAVEAIEVMVRTLEERTADLRNGGKDKHRQEQVNEYITGYNDLAVSAGPLGLTECQGVVL